MKRYKIADHLTDDEKRLVCSAEYTPHNPFAYTDFPFPQTSGCMCPLGLVIEDRMLRETIVWREEETPTNPVPGIIAKYMAVDEETVKEFTDDWDRGRIPQGDLPAALGLQ